MSHHEPSEKHDHPASVNHTCKVCTSAYSHETNPSRFGICERCGYKVLILLFIVMIAISYVAWFGIF